MSSSLELPPIGWQLFILGNSKSDSTAFPLFLDTYATRLLAEPVSCGRQNSFHLTRDCHLSLSFCERMLSLGARQRAYIPGAAGLSPYEQPAPSRLARRPLLDGSQRTPREDTRLRIGVAARLGTQQRLAGLYNAYRCVARTSISGLLSNWDFGTGYSRIPRGTRRADAAIYCYFSPEGATRARSSSGGGAKRTLSQYPRRLN